MFGSTVLVPILFGVDPATILLMNGIGTLLYIFITKGKIPAYLGSSFAFISPVIVVLTAGGGYGASPWRFFVVGLVLSLVGFIVKFAGTNWIDVIFPPAAMGAIVAVIGLELVPVAADMAGLIAAPDAPKRYDCDYCFLINTRCNDCLLGYIARFFKNYPYSIRNCTGYVIATIYGIVDYTAVKEAAWIQMPTYYQIEFNWSDILNYSYLQR